MTDLTTQYLGFELSSPLVASAGPLTSRLDTLEMLQAAGAAAVVLPSLFEEEVIASGLELHALHTQGTESFAFTLNGTNAVLAGYNIQSMDLITK